ncbi:hypothetical protein JCM8547_001401 [Rhodosporidiobolus lusitaniae]
MSSPNVSKLPAPPAALVSTNRSDIYEATSPLHALSGAAKGLSVLVTGSGRGCGRAEAIAFAQAGAKKIVLTARTRTELDEVKARIDEEGKETEVIVVEANITNPESVEKLFEQAGELDVLVNNAGYLEKQALIRDSNPEDWLRTNRINIDGTYLCTRAFLRAAHNGGLINDSGRKLTIINTTSLGSALTSPGYSSYQPGKTMVNRFTEFIHFEEPAVRTFAIHPGGVQTKLATGHPFDLPDQPELAAGLALWLATQDKADFLRGKYVSANWDVDELIAKKDEILKGDLLWTRVVGQASAVPK